MHDRQMQVRMAQHAIARVIVRYFDQRDAVRHYSRTLFDGCCVLAPVSTPLPRQHHESERLLDTSLDMSEPISLCWYLEERLGLPRIPRIRWQRIPTTLDIQDLAAFHNPKAVLDMTIESLARGLATWLKRCHPKVLAQLAA